MTKRAREKRKIRYSDAKQVAKDRDVGFVSDAYKVPEGISIFRWNKEKTYKLDIIGYVVGKGNPMADEDTIHYERTYYCHRDVGPKKAVVGCNAKNFGTKCAVCELKDKLSADKEAEKKMVDSLKYKERQLMLVRDHDDLEKGWQILDTAYYKSFGELLESKIKAGDDDMPFHKFYHLSGGMTLKVLVEEDSFDGRKYFKPTNIEMIPRKKDIPEEVLDDLPCLDDLLVQTDYKELKKLVLQAPDDDDEEEEEDEEETEDTEDEDGDADEEESDDDEKEDDDEGGEEEDSEKPSKKSKTSKKKASTSSSKSSSSKSSKKKDDDEDEEEEDDDSESDEDEDEESDEDNEEEEDEEKSFSKGDRVAGEYRGKKFTGKVLKLVNGLVQVKTKSGDTRTCDPDELELLDEEEEAPKKSGKSSKTTSTKKSSKSKDEDDEEDDEELELDEDEDDEEEDEEDDD